LEAAALSFPFTPGKAAAVVGFGWVLERLAEHGLIKGDRIGVDAEVLGLDPRMEANAIVRPDKR
jgi:hypothetical protein